MKAMTANDTCFSTMKGHWASVFNTDGLERDHIDIEEARSALDFKIEKHPSYDAHGNELAGHFHLRRDTDDAFIPCPAVGAKFQPVQHLEVFDYICNKIMPEVPDMKLETVGTLHGAGTGLVTATVGDKFSINGDDSPHTMRLLFSNPCGRGSLVLGFTSVRIFCQNCIAAARKEARKDGFFVRHTSGAGLYVEAAVQSIAAQMRMAQALRARCERLAGLPVNKATLAKALDRIYPQRFEQGTPAFGHIEQIRHEVEFQFDGGATAQTMKGDTAWKLFNSFTYPVFNPEKLGTRMDLAEVAYNGSLGSRANKVTHILNTIEELAA